MKVKNHTYTELALADDYEGKVIATLISADANTHNRPAILYVHGFIDYFFHPHLSEFFTQNGFDFYAVELRKYGHSWLPHQHPNYCRDIEEYFEEFDMAIEQITEKSGHPVILLGHSTGGLSTSLYLNKGMNKGRVAALVLNSPFLETNVPSAARAVLKPMSKWISSVAPFAKLDGMLPPIYPSSVHKNYHGEWEFNLKFKPIKGFPVYFRWSYAIMKAQDYLKKHSQIPQPVLLLHSHDSYLPKKHEDRVMKSDIVLNVGHMKAIGPQLGINVTLIEIQNGLHDLYLSPSPVRDNAMNKTLEWLKSIL